MSKNSNLPKEYVAKVGKNWDAMTLHHPVYTTDLKLRWWQSPLIMRYYNKKISGDSKEGVTLLIKNTLKENNRVVLDQAISVGCGYAEFEIQLLKEGVVKFFHLFDFSEVQRKRTLELAQKNNVLDKVSFRKDDAFTAFTTEYFDLVFWNKALHHMPSAEEAVIWSRNVLKPKGIFCMEEWIGENRFQFSKATTDFITWVRTVLPAKYLKNPFNQKKYLPRTFRNPSAQKLIDRDPSEAIDGENIIPSLKKHFPGIKITEICGIVFHLALEDIIYNFDEKNEYDKALLSFLVALDDLAINLPTVKNLMATAIAIK